MEYKTIGGILTLILMLGGSAGTLYYIQSTGVKSSCKTGWEYYNETTWQCGERQEICFKVTNSSNTKNYWCEKGIITNTTEIIPIEEPKIIETEIINKPIIKNNTEFVNYLNKTLQEETQGVKKEVFKLPIYNGSIINGDYEVNTSLWDTNQIICTDNGCRYAKVGGK